MISPDWVSTLLGGPLPSEGESAVFNGQTLTMQHGIPRANSFVSEAQGQTGDVFGFKWAKRDTFEGETINVLHNWLLEKYGDVTSQSWFSEHGEHPIILDAGCGAAMSGLAFFGPVLDRIRYLGVDVSTSVDTAKARFEEKGLSAGFLQCDLATIPLPKNCVDIVFSEGVLHHTDDTRASLGAVTRHLKVGGRALFYVYRKKGPVREFTDDYIRDQMQTMTPEEGWAAMEPLTRLGKALGELDIEIDIPEAVDVLEIPAGKINLQRLFYWHVFKAFYRPELSIDEMNHINFDWYAPQNAHRHTIEDVRRWCADFGLEIEHERVEMAGITIIAKKTAG
jgi:arsenite methyltransferase